MGGAAHYWGFRFFESLFNIMIIIEQIEIIYSIVFQTVN